MSPFCKFRAQGHHAAVDLGAGAAVAHFRVDGIGKIHQRGAPGQFLDIAGGGKGINLIRIELQAHPLQEFLGVLQLLLEVHHLLEPGEALGVLFVEGPPLLVAPVGRNAFFGHPVHLPGADLDFQAFAALADHRGVDGLVHVGLGHADIVFEASRHRPKQGVDDPQGFIAFMDRVHDDAKGQEIVEFIQGDLLGLELAVDAVEIFDPPVHFPLDVVLLQFVPEELAHVLVVFLQGALLPGQALLDLLIGLRLQVEKGQVFQLGLEAEHAQAAGQGGVDIQGLPGDALLLGGLHEPQGPHVVDPVGQLHQQDPDVVGHGEDHLADIFRLLGLPVAEDQLADLGDPVDHIRHFLAEVFFQIVQGGGGVLHRVVEQAGGDGDGPQAHLGQDDRPLPGGGTGKVRRSGAAGLHGPWLKRCRPSR